MTWKLIRSRVLSSELRVQSATHPCCNCTARRQRLQPARAALVQRNGCAGIPARTDILGASMPNQTPAMPRVNPSSRSMHVHVLVSCSWRHRLQHHGPAGARAPRCGQGWTCHRPKAPGMDTTPSVTAGEATATAGPNMNGARTLIHKPRHLGRENGVVAWESTLQGPLHSPSKPCRTGGPRQQGGACSKGGCGQGCPHYHGGPGLGARVQ